MKHPTRLAHLTSLAEQVKGHLQTSSYTSHQLEMMTGANHHDIIDCLTWLVGEGHVRQVIEPRYTLLKPSASSDNLLPLPSPEATGLQALGFRSVCT